MRHTPHYSGPGAASINIQNIKQIPINRYAEVAVEKFEGLVGDDEVEVINPKQAKEPKAGPKMKSGSSGSSGGFKPACLSSATEGLQARIDRAQGVHGGAPSSPPRDWPTGGPSPATARFFP